MHGSKRAGLVAIIIASVLWGASFFFGKLALAEIPADQVVLWRFVLAIIVLGPLVAVRRSRRIRAARRPGSSAPQPRPLLEDWRLFLLNAAVMVPIQFMLQFEGLSRTTASSAALIVGGFPPMLAVAAVFLAKEWMNGLGWGAVALSTVGMVVMVGSPGAGRTLLGDMLVLISLVAAVGMVLVTQRLVRRHDSLVVTVVSMAVGTLLLLPWSLAVSGLPTLSFSPGIWGALLGLGILCTAITFSLWNWGLRVVPASHAGVYINLEPLIGAILGISLLGEAVTWELIAGGSLILVAAVAISWPDRAAVELPAESIVTGG